jgi:hypothetical protein
MTPERNFLLVSLTPVKLSKTVKVSLTGVVDTGKELFTGINDTGEACIAGVVDWQSTEIIECLREYLKKIEIITRLVYWGQEKLFEEKTRGKQSRGTVPLSEVQETYNNGGMSR